MLLEMRLVCLGLDVPPPYSAVEGGIEGFMANERQSTWQYKRNFEDISHQSGASGFRKSNGWERKSKRRSGEVDVESEERIGVWVPFGTSPFVAAAGAVASASLTLSTISFIATTKFLFYLLKKQIFLYFGTLTTRQQIWIQSLNRRPNRYSGRSRDESSCDVVQITNRKTLN